MRIRLEANRVNDRKYGDEVLLVQFFDSVRMVAVGYMECEAIRIFDTHQVRYSQWAKTLIMDKTP